MPTLVQTKTALKRKVSGNIGNVLKELGAMINPNEKAFNTLIGIEAAFRRLEAQQQLITVSPEQLNVGYASITQSILTFIDSLEEDDILTVRLLQYEVYERILVVVKSKERKQYMQQFFPTDYFRNVYYEDSGQSQLAKGIDIVLYDDTPQPGEGVTDELLLHYLENTDAVVLYFGRHSPLVWKYPEKAYATNSVFSLHARIKEMTEYLKYKEAFDQQQKNTTNE
ncbi:MAG: hypothetical protein H6559_10115 [Lewinellaceae bacterium]|nr:hypothetical protein [Lewinellaceae bacterium]